jgi:TonB-dependent starch-binding outer membrane protein SusC
MKKSLPMSNRWYLFLVLLFMALFSYGQVPVSGIVTDVQDQNALVGVSIVEKGTTKGTITDVNGKYSLNVSKNAILVFSFTGYDAQEIPVGTRSTLDVSLGMSENILQEVVVVGYGTQKEKEVTGAVGSVKGDMLVKSPVSDLGQAIQGQVAGVNVQAASGRPGEAANVQIRGLGSLSAGALGPLYVVDGVPFQGNPNLAPEQIESIDILKDGAAASIYGTRASNGVILITTKRGEKGKMKVGFNAYHGVQNITSGTPLMNATQQMYEENVKLAALGRKPLIFFFQPNALDYNSDFVRDVQDNNAPIQSYNLSVSGGQNNLTLAVNTNYFKQDGILLNSGFDRLSNRITGEFKRDKFRAFTSVGYTIENQQQEPYALYEYAIAQTPWQVPLGQVPTEGASVQLAVRNPILYGYLSRELKNVDERKTNSSNIAINLEYELLKGLSVQANLGRNSWDYRRKFFRPQYLVNGSDGQLNPTASRLDAILTEDFTFTQRNVLETMLKYNKQFGKHQLNLLGVLSYENFDSKQLSTGVIGLLNNETQTLGAGSSGTKPSSYNFSNALTGKLFRMQYNYNDRYLLSASFRRDGSSNFGPANRYGNFFGVSGGWNVSDETFFRSLNLKFISNLKLRASFAEVGNQNISPYSFATQIEAGVNYPFGENEDLAFGNIQRRYGNPFIQWETNLSKNLGLNLTMFNGKLDLVADIYQNDKSNMLLPERLPPSTGTYQPRASGVFDTRVTNAGNMVNKGVELSLNYRDETEFGLKWNAGFTFTRNRNEVTNLNGIDRGYANGRPIVSLGTNIDYTTYLALNQPAGAFYLVQNAGVVKTQEALTNYRKIDPSAQLGDLMMVDQLTVDTDGDGVPDAGDGRIDDNDRIYMGSGQPIFESGFNTNVYYKNFDLFVQLYGTYGSKIYNGAKLYAYTQGRHLDQYYMWSPQNPDSDVPTDRENAYHSNVRARSDYFLEDGSYMRIRNLTLGYTVPKRLFKNKIETLRIYFTAMNPFTFTNYTGYDPEVGGDGIFLRGVDRGNYPVSRRFLGGIQLNF